MSTGPRTSWQRGTTIDASVEHDGDIRFGQWIGETRGHGLLLPGANDVTERPTADPAIRVTFMPDTPEMFQRALARRFVAADVPVAYVDGPRPATKSVGDDVGLVVTFLVGAAVGGITYDLERELLRRALEVLQGILSEVPFRADIRVQDQLTVTEYVLPNGQESGRALDAYLVDHDAGRWRGGRLRWSPELGWVAVEPNTSGFMPSANRLGPFEEGQSGEWVSEQLRIANEHHARVAWAVEMLRDDGQSKRGN